MTDDEMVERLRLARQADAAAITRSAEHDRGARLSPPVAPHAPRPPWPIAVAAVAVAVAAVVLGALDWPGGHRESSVGVIGAPPASVVVPQTPTTIPAVAPSTVPGVPTTPSTPTTVTATTLAIASPAVPVGFAPESVTFVSPSDGWVAGSAPCASGVCLALVRTADGGHTWHGVGAPGVTLPSPSGGQGALSVRFADGNDGWIYTTDRSRASAASTLWSTHDAGQRWGQVTLTALTQGGQITAMEAAGGRVHVAVMSMADGKIVVESSPVGADSWTGTGTGVPIGAGPVPGTQLVFQGASGWILEDDRVVVGGARLDGEGGWSAWNPPCLTANGTAELAASTAADLVAVCDEGLWGPAANLASGAAVPSEWVFSSSDGGTSFHVAGRTPSSATAEEIASPSPSTIVIGGAASGAGNDALALTASFDGGRNWQTVYHGPAASTVADLGFTTLNQGVAVVSGQSRAFLVMTRDGGRHWAPVALTTGN